MESGTASLQAKVLPIVTVSWKDEGIAPFPVTLEKEILIVLEGAKNLDAHWEENVVSSEDKRDLYRRGYTPTLG